MRIGIRLAAALAIALVALLTLYAWMDLRASRRQLELELSREGRAVARTAQLAIEDYLRDRQLEDIREFLGQVSDYERVLGIRVFSGAGELAYQSPSLEPYPFVQHEALVTVLASGREVVTRRRIRDDPFLGFLVPLNAPDGSLGGALQLLQHSSFIEEEIAAARRRILLLAGFGVAGIVVLVPAITWLGVSRPTRELVRSFREVGKGDLGTRVPVRGRDEFGVLAQEFNAMCARLVEVRDSLIREQEERRRAEASLREAERLAGLGRLAAGLAHEIGTPLNVIGGRAESLQRRLGGDEDAVRKLQVIGDQIARISRIVQGMLDFARQREPRFAPVDPAAVVRNIVEFLESRLASRGVRAVLAGEESLPRVHGDADRLSEVFLNLVLNAADAMPDGGELRIVRASGRFRPPGRGEEVRCAVVSLRDQGPGIDPEILPRIFDPFFTTKDVGEGTGLGLAIAYGIVADHGGWIDVSGPPGAGSTFTVYLPAPEGESEE